MEENVRFREVFALYDSMRLRCELTSLMKAFLAGDLCVVVFDEPSWWSLGARASLVRGKKSSADGRINVISHITRRLTSIQVRRVIFAWYVICL